MLIKLCDTKGCPFYGRYCRVHRDEKPSNQRIITIIPKVSEPRKVENKVYDKNKKKYLAEHVECEAVLPGCTKLATQIHHKRKRRTQDDRVNPDKFLAVCHSCHVLIEANPKMAFENNLSEKAID